MEYADLAGALIEIVGAVVLITVSAVVLPWLRKRYTGDAATAVLNALEAAVGPAVLATEQTVARRMRATAPSVGSLSAPQAAAVLADAVDRALGVFGEDKLDAFAKALGFEDRAALRPVLVSLIEARVHELKLARAGVAIGGVS